MTLAEIQQNIKGLSRREKFELVQQLIVELARDEQQLSEHLASNRQHAFWSQHNAFEAAQKLQEFLERQR